MQKPKLVTDEVEGMVVLAQEDRFSVKAHDGRTVLFVLAADAGPTMRDIHEWARTGRKVVVTFRGDPALGAVAEKVRPAWA